MPAPDLAALTRAATEAVNEIEKPKRKWNGQASREHPPKPTFTLYADLEADSSKSWLVDKMLGAGEMSAWYGAPGCGKGVVIEDMALHIAAGLEWHGRPVTRGAVVYIALERKKLVERRAIAFRTKYGLLDLPFGIVGGVYDFRQAATADQIADICKQVAEQTTEQVELIIVDTVSRALAGGDENSPRDMGALIMTAGLLQQKCPAHVLWIHHIPHDKDRLRGHGALLGAVDTTVSVSSGSVRTAKVVKANDSEEGESIAFTIESVIIHEDGTTAPIAVAAAGAVGKLESTKRKLPDRARLGLDALADALADYGKPAPESLGLPTGVNVVTLDQWRGELCCRSVLDRDSNNHWRDFSRIRDQLAARQAIGVRDSMVWKI